MGDTRSSDAAARTSGRFLLRMDPGLHAVLRAAAAEAGISLNEYCVRKLAAPGGSLTGAAGAAEIVLRAASLFGERLAAVAVFGSWVRGEHREGSDVDVLVVLDASLPIRRELYRAWDEEPLDLDGLPVEPHLVHLPEDPREAGGLWAEVALDGAVLFERGLLLSRALARIRRAILAGHLSRREVDGQAYWVHEAR